MFTSNFKTAATIIYATLIFDLLFGWQGDLKGLVVSALTAGLAYTIGNGAKWAVWTYTAIVGCGSLMFLYIIFVCVINNINIFTIVSIFFIPTTIAQIIAVYFMHKTNH